MSDDLWIGKYGIMFEEFDRSKMDEVIYYIQSIPGVHSVYTCKTDKTWGMECADLGVIAKGEEVLERVTFFVDRLDYIYDICPVSFTRYSVCENSGCEESVECGLDGHREAYRFGFGRVLDELEKGNRCMRDGWNGKDMYITLKRPNLFSDMTVPYIYMKTVQGDYVPWLASQSDLLSEDWGLYRYG